MKKAARLSVVVGFGMPTFYLFWIVFVGTFSLHELLIGILGTLLATLGVAVVTLQYPARFSPNLAELISLWQVAWYVISGTWEILAVAATDLVGTEKAKSLFRVVPFEAGKEDDPHAAARRALAVLYTTVAPNFIILGVNSNDVKLLFHQIKRSAVPSMTKQLGAAG